MMSVTATAGRSYSCGFSPGTTAPSARHKVFVVMASPEPRPTSSVEPLLYKKDWPEARERFLAFWEREIIDRACISVCAPRQKRVLLPESPNIEFQQTDPDLHQARLHAEFSNQYYGGEALPISGTHLGYAVFGGEPGFARGPSGYQITDYVFVEPVIEDWQRTPYRFDPNSKWCQRFIEITRREIAESAGKYLTTLGAVLPPTDVLGLLRGYGSMCLDMVDHPEQMREALRELLGARIWLNDWFYDAVDANQHGTPVMGMWGPGRNIDVLCDFSCLISPELYRDFVMPEIEALTRDSDHNFYHLDGADALQHLDALLELEDLNGIQFTPGIKDEHTPVTRWLPMFKRVLDAGKLVQVGARYEEVESVLEALGPRGVFISSGAPSVEAADALLRNVARWSCRR